jgi:hypothetical protein
MDAFLNLALFVVVFYMITLYAGWPERRKEEEVKRPYHRGIFHGPKSPELSVRENTP